MYISKLSQQPVTITFSKVATDQDLAEGRQASNTNLRSDQTSHYTCSLSQSYERVGYKSNKKPDVRNYQNFQVININPNHSMSIILPVIGTANCFKKFEDVIGNG
jgi:hypothetical protein